MESSSHKIRNVVTYGLIAALALVATLFGISNGRILGVTPGFVSTPTPTVVPVNPVDAQPAPDLFKTVDLLPVARLLSLENLSAGTDIDDYYASRPKGSAADDAAFIRWASRRANLKPSAAQRTFEQAQQLRILKKSAKKDLSARWLGVHGCGDVWTSYALEQMRFHAADAPTVKKSDLTAVLDLAARVAAAAQKRLAAGNSAAAATPCVPSSASSQADCGCSYPSSTAAMAAAARTYLTALQPRSGRQYSWMEQQVDTAALYEGVEVTSDVRAGAYLGYLVGRYFIASRGFTDLTPTPTPTPTVR